MYNVYKYGAPGSSRTLYDREGVGEENPEEKRSMIIRTASVYEFRKVPAEQRAEYGLRVLIMRKWPRGIRRTNVNVWMPSAAPSDESLDAWHAKKITWESFLQQYRQDQLAQTSCHVVT